MKTRFKKLIAILTALIMTVGILPATALGQSGYVGCEDVTGQYRFVSNEETSIELTDDYVYNDSWFTGSSYEFSQQLATLSAIVCETSVSYYKPVEGSPLEKLNDERDSSLNSKNLEAFLKDVQFSDVEVNSYYNTEKEQNSAGCAVGHKTVKDGGKEYTLLAVIPRSAGYKQEWAGNFTVGDTGMHEGFKHGRDEILRFVRSYVRDHGITGDVKIWTAGHSRGAALANSVGAFMAQAGADFLGVSLDPKDVYAYTFATPRTIVREGASAADTFSVEAARSGRYALDTPGDGYAYAGTGTVTPHEGVFLAVHNCMPQYDIIDLLPPERWDFTAFGKEFAITDGSAETKEKMLSYLAGISEFAYNAYVNGGDESDFTWKTFDLTSLEAVDDTSVTTPVTQGEFFAERVRQLTYKAADRSGYVNGEYQDTLAALAGIYGMDQYDFFPALINDQGTAARAAIFSYLAYAAERLMDEERAETEEEAIALALEYALEWALGIRIDPATFSVDDLVYQLSKYMIDNADIEYGQLDEVVDENEDYNDYTQIKSITFNSKTVEMVAEALSNAVLNAIPPEYQAFIPLIIPGWDTMTEDQKKEAAVAFVFGFLNTAAYGNGSKDHPGTPEEAKEGRQNLYIMLGLFFSSYPEILDAIGREDETKPYSDLDGHKPATGLLTAVLPILLGENETVGEAADVYLADLIGTAMEAVYNSGRYAEDSIYYQDLQMYEDVLKTHTRHLREMVTYGLLYDEDMPFSAAQNIRNAATFISQAGKVPVAHYNEVYLAWMKAQDPAYPHQDHQLEHIARVEPTCVDPGSRESWHCTVCGKYFTSKAAKETIDEKDVVIDAQGHDWGPWKVVKEATATETGLKRRVCRRDKSHVDEKVIPVKGKEESEQEEDMGEQDAARKAPVILLARMISKGSTAVTIDWTKVRGADGYDVYFARCNRGKKTYPYQKIKTVTGNKTFRCIKKGLKKHAEYKAYVRAWKWKDGKKVKIARSLSLHACSTGGKSKLSNPKSVKVKKTKVILKKGKTYKIRAKVTKLDRKKGLFPRTGHVKRKVRFVSSNPGVAAVNASGRIKAKSKGICKVYAIAANGVRKAVKVTVR